MSHHQWSAMWCCAAPEAFAEAFDAAGGGAGSATTLRFMPPADGTADSTTYVLWGYCGAVVLTPRLVMATTSCGKQNGL
jgi:hypothetical protein